MDVLIGHASIDAYGNETGGHPGDQNGDEICTRNWYDKPWIKVFRPISKKESATLALIMEAACENDHIGFSKDKEENLKCEKLAKKVNWDLRKIEEDCALDNIQLISLCLNAAGISLSRQLTIENAESCLTRSKKFNIFSGAKYLKSSCFLKRGDILLAKDHMAIVLSDGNEMDYITYEVPKNDFKIMKTSNLSLIGTGVGVLALSKDNVLRIGPDDKYSICEEVKKKNKLEVIAKTGDWYRVVYPNTLCGYAYLKNDESITFLPKEKKPNITIPSVPKIVKYNIKPIKPFSPIYNGPGEEFTQTGLVRENLIYTILKEQNGWGFLSSGNGWIKLSETKRV